MSRYAAVHAAMNGAGDARPTALQIVKDENLLGKLVDKVMLVTGASSGIGVETLRALHATGATVFATARNAPKGQQVIDEIRAAESANKAEIHLIEMDLESLESVRKGAREILGKTDKLNIVINNAGVMATPEGRTKDGFETQFGTCHLAHFLLFQLLKPILLKSATPEFPSRVVNLSSIGHQAGPVRFDDYKFEKAPYTPWGAYGQAKTANIYMANEIERRYSSKNLHATSVHPGGIATGLQIHSQDMMDEAAKDPKKVAYMKSPEQGASTTIYAALSEEWKNQGGKYLVDCQEAGPYSGGQAGTAGGDGYATWAYDEEAEGRLWRDSCKMVGVEDDT